MGLLQRVWTYAERQELLKQGDSVVVGVSGGPDSLCLLDILHRLSRRLQLALTVAHFNHGLREAAGDEARFVEAEAAARGLACVVEAAETAAFAHARGLGLEEAARQLRYAFLARVAQSSGTALIAVAHTADDQAETVLMHLLRGSGLSGLRGIAAKVKAGPAVGADIEESAAPFLIVRPLLSTTRAEVEAYCAERGLVPRQDDTNRDTQYFRNWVRHTALPVLETRNPNLRATLARTAEVLAGELDLAEAAVVAAWERAVPPGWQAPGMVVFDRAELRPLTLPLVRGLLRRGVAALQGEIRDVGFAPLDAAARFVLSAKPGRTCELPGGLRLAVLLDRLVLTEASISQPAPGPHVDANGKLAGGWRLVVTRLEPGHWTWASVEAAGTWEAYVDEARIAGPLVVRARTAGERFRPLGLGGHRAKISDYMVNHKVPVAWRAGWPVVACSGEVVWLAGLQLDERYRVRPDTGAVLRLTFVRGGTEDG